MSNLPAARSELDRIEAFLRTRYHYPHPIFERVATCRGYLEDELPTGAVEAPQETAADAVPKEPEPEPAVEAVAEEPVAEEPVVEEPAAEEASEEPSPEKVAAPKPRRRKTRRKSR